MMRIQLLAGMEAHSTCKGIFGAMDGAAGDSRFLQSLKNSASHATIYIHILPVCSLQMDSDEVR